MHLKEGGKMPPDLTPVPFNTWPWMLLHPLPRLLISGGFSLRLLCFYLPKGEQKNSLLLSSCVFVQSLPTISVDFLTQLLERRVYTHHFCHLLLNPLAVGLPSHHSIATTAAVVPLISKLPNQMDAFSSFLTRFLYSNYQYLKLSSSWLEVIHSFCFPPSFLFLHSSFDYLCTHRLWSSDD